MMLVDAGPRRAELLGMRLEDVNFEYDVVRVLGKGGRELACRSAAKPPWRSTATSVPDRATGSPTWTRSGSASAGRSPSRGFAT
jgi:integrase